MVYPIGRHVGSSLGGLIVGAIFAAAGWYLIVEEGHVIFGGVFGGVGALIGIFGLYLMLNSLEVSKEAAHIMTVRRLLGIPISRKQMHQNSFERFKKKSTMKTQSGGKHVIYYSVYAIDRQGNEIVLGEGFKGESEAQAAVRVIAKELGLRAPDPLVPANAVATPDRHNALLS
jgi:membrane-bound ClpP family serine protease